MSSFELRCLRVWRRPCVLDVILHDTTGGSAEGDDGVR